MVYKGKEQLKSYNAYLKLVKRIQNNEWENYDFTNSVYVNNSTKLKVSCKTHGEFWITPGNLKNGSNCAVCYGNGKKSSLSYQKEVEKRFPTIKVLGTYINNYTKIVHRHKTCGYEWETRPRAILSGHGCPKCSACRFDPTKPAILYYLSVKNGTAFKIGITNRTVHERYSNEELLDITLLKEWYFDVGQEAYDMEQSILKQYKEFKYKGKKLLKSGNTELFFLDVLDLVRTTV